MNTSTEFAQSEFARLWQPSRSPVRSEQDRWSKIYLELSYSVLAFAKGNFVQDNPLRTL